MTSSGPSDGRWRLIKFTVTNLNTTPAASAGPAYWCGRPQLAVTDRRASSDRLGLSYRDQMCIMQILDSKYPEIHRFFSSRLLASRTVRAGPDRENLCPAGPGVVMWKILSVRLSDIFCSSIEWKSLNSENQLSWDSRMYLEYACYSHG